MERLFLAENKYYDDFLSMGKDVYLYPGRFYKFFASKIFLRALYEDKERYHKYAELMKENPSPDVFLFKMSYILNPYMSLRYHKFIFASYKEVGQAILSYGPTIDVYLKDLLICGLLKDYMVSQGDDKKQEGAFQTVCLCQKEADEDVETAYWKLGFLLSGTKELIYEGVKFTSPSEFFSSRLVLSSLVPFSRTFLQDKLVLTWLRISGEEKKVNEFLSLQSVADEKDAAADEKMAQDLDAAYSTEKGREK